jgi:hypothetical protein
LKPKTAFESGNSPPKISESGATILTGRGLEETKRRIMDAFEKIRQHPVHPAQQPVQHSEPTPPPTRVDYTEENKVRFHERARRLSIAALSSSHIMKATRGPVFEIAVPTETLEELYKAALGGTNERT